MVGAAGRGGGRAAGAGVATTGRPPLVDEMGSEWDCRTYVCMSVCVCVVPSARPSLFFLFFHPSQVSSARPRASSQSRDAERRHAAPRISLFSRRHSLNLAQHTTTARATMSTRRRAFMKGLDADESRRKREDTIIELRKSKRDESLQKKRAVFGGGAPGAGGLGAPGLDATGSGVMADGSAMEDSTRATAAARVSFFFLCAQFSAVVGGGGS